MVKILKRIKVGKTLMRFKEQRKARKYFGPPNLIERILFMINFSICKYKGHKLTSEDYATPDSGYIGVYCERCGFRSGSHLY